MDSNWKKAKGETSRVELNVFAGLYQNKNVQNYNITYSEILGFSMAYNN